MSFEHLSISNVTEGRAPWTRWTAAEDASLCLHAHDLTAREIGLQIGRTVEQVRGRAKRLGVHLELQLWARRRLNDRISASMVNAWADPEKRERMLAPKATAKPNGDRIEITNMGFEAASELARKAA
jgi:hypothetical protein